MSQQNEGSSSLSPVIELHGKRKRGRPCKDGNPTQLYSQEMPKSDGSGNSQQVNEVAQSSTNEDGMVGQFVYGVVEGTFDAGYLLSVRVGNTDTLLRGLVFQEGHFTPVFEANDVAPHAKMYKRKNVPIPILINPQTHVNSSTPLVEPNSKQPIHFPEHPPMILGQVKPYEPSSSLGAKVCSSGNLQKKNNLGISLGELPSAQTLPVKPLPSRFSSQLEHNSFSGKQLKVYEEFKASSFQEAPMLDMEATKDFKILAPESATIIDVFPGSEVNNREPQIQHEFVGSELNPSHLVQVEKDSPKKSIPGDTRVDPTNKASSGDETSDNGKQVKDAVEAF
ncbi:uncharacterized protein LOC131153610 isoform X2 [Malania oleifera]|uniref:uncharacterized protein LOC131153610 isoform X2 n=1 Tax=Malania oleifera TaxID=397392 RepID=UPI0025AE1F92|nr:uncharacterized protein LOC131153610 isoform X2 [Malania oleifera]